MRKSRFTEQQIFNALKEVEAGASIAEVCRRVGISTQTFHRWKAKYEGLDVSELRRLKALEAENFELKKLLADTLLQKNALEDLVLKKAWGDPSKKKL